MKLTFSILPIIALLIVSSCSEVKVDIGDQLPDTNYPNGNKKAEYEVKEGKLQGKYIEYHENGNVKFEGQYEDNVQTGLWKKFYENGILFEENMMSNGAYNGLQKVYHTNGQLAVIGNAVNNLEDGEWWFFDLDGDTLKMENYQNGKVVNEVEYQPSEDLYKK
ncbi:MAG: hypothetical protein GC178_08660 [Flavobacteriales bacterium]|nr:hypothetical protein [Flavobacteriales bacterium]